MTTTPIERLLSIGKPHARRERNIRRAQIARAARRALEKPAIKASTLPAVAPRKSRTR